MDDLQDQREDEGIEESQANNSLEKVSNTAKKRVTLSSKTNAVKKSLIKALMPILTWVFVILLVIIIIIGIVMFFLVMPGMAMEKLKQLAKKIGNAFAAFFGEDTTHQIDDQEIYDVLDYLEQMGYDLKGYGFLTDYVGENSDGVERDENDNITNAKSEFIFTYLVSDNYVYTLANKNQSNGAATDDHRITGALLAILQKVGNFMTNGQLGQYWGRGMLSVYHEDSIGTIGDYFGGAEDWFGWSDIEIVADENSNEKKLKIRRGYGSDSKEFNLEGWTGRYGMPLDFLLSVHLATMMPDLAYDMVKNFDTQVVILLHKTGNYFNGNAEYFPYVSYVRNHWYRDVYFVSDGSQEFVDYDYDYEAIMKDRWTLYETYTSNPDDGDLYNPDKVGEFVYYKFDDSKDNGIGERYDGEVLTGERTISNDDGDRQVRYGSVGEDGTIVVKKAKTIKLDDVGDDLNWNKEDGKWMAYQLNDEGDLVQTGEGQRTETNSKIKKMFLKNTYFRYDGSSETAEAITELRKNNEIEFGALDESKIKKSDSDNSGEYYKDVEVNGKTYSVADVSGQVSLEQDALNAFSMLENEHTLDSDYIYRDFKELIVELGYYKKEELTDETPRLLEFIVPDIGSGATGSSQTSSIDGERIVEAAKRVYDYCVKNNYQYKDSSTEVGLIDISNENGETTNGVKETMCSGYVTSVLVEAGFYDKEKFKISSDKYYPPYAKDFWRFGKSGKEMDVKTTGTESSHKEIIEYMNDKFQDMELVQDTWDGSDSNNGGIDVSKLQAGDILVRTYSPKSDDSGHVAIYDGDGYIYENGTGHSKVDSSWTRVLRIVNGNSSSSGGGTSGFPDRTIDKRENEFGTMIHSKRDIDTNRKHTLAKLYEKISEMEEETPERGNAEEPQNSQSTSKKSNDISDHEITSQNPDDISTSTQSNVGLNNVGAIGASVTYERVEESGEGYVSVVESGNVKYIHRYQGGQPYSNILFTWAGETNTLGDAACGLFACFNVLTGYGYDFDPNKDLPGFNWAATMDSVKTLMEEKGVSGQFVDSTDTAAVEFALNEGRPVILLFSAGVTDKQGVCWTTAGHFVALVGKDKDGNILTLDSAAQGNIKRHDYPGTVDDMQPAFQSSPIWIADEAPSGSKKSGGGYEGYLGNEAVVSPVTGVLLEYGTYTDEDKDSVSGEEYRTNVDLKYGPANYLVSQNDPNDNSSNGNNSSNNSNSGSQTYGQIVTDKVGYAKILVLDEENFKKLEASLLDDSSNVKKALKSDGNKEKLLNDNGNYNDISNLSDETTKEWKDIDKTLYGYKEFAESYKNAGISGYVVYIDGFKCELPDDEFDIKNKDTKKPKGKKITIDDFSKITESSFDDKGNLTADEDVMDSKYEKDDEYKMASKKATDKLNAEIDVKNDAISTITINGITLIKEGTVIGRTLTDKEVVEDYGDGARGDYSKKSSEELIGNYLRIVMRDLDKTVIENVEDYMKLDDGEDEPNTQDEDFSVVGTVFSEEEWVEMAYKYAVENNCSSVFQNKDNLREYYKINVDIGVNPEYTFVRGIQESGLSDGASGGGINFWGYGTPNGSSLSTSYGTWQKTLEAYCKTIVEYQDPSTWQYQEIMKRKSERESCTENGGIDKLGYGDPKTVGGQQSLYSWLGDTHAADDAGSGGMYYLHPWHHGLTQYEGENKIIFESKVEFESLCGSKHGTTGGSTSSTPTTVWEQGMYTAWQSRQIVKLAKSIFTEKAGTYAAK